MQAVTRPGFDEQAREVELAAEAAGLASYEFGYDDRGAGPVLTIKRTGAADRIEVTPRRRGEHAGSNLAHYPTDDDQADWVVTFTAGVPYDLVRAIAQRAIERTQ